MKPSELGICNPDDDLTYILAWESTETRMLAWEREQPPPKQKKGMFG